MSQAYVLLAHGSRRAASNQEVEALAQALATRLGAAVAPAFIEQATPDLATTVAALVDQGTTQIRVIPYLLAAGRHLAEDIPALLTDCRQRWPALDIHLTPHVGNAPLLVELLAGLATSDAGRDTNGPMR